MNGRIAALAERVLREELLSREDAACLAAVGGDEIYDLFYWANKIRIRFIGRDVKFCALVPAKFGGCSEDCKFCAQSSHYHTAVVGQRRLTDQQILESADKAVMVGAYNFGIVNSGRGPTRRELEQWLRPIMEKIASEGKLRACADLGTLTPETAKFLFENGIRRVNHNLETSERFYPQIVSTHPYSERLRTLRIAKEAGLELCSGGIFGMGETWEDRLDMVFTLRDIGVDVMPINFLNAIPGTPLQHLEKLPAMECLKIIAVCRFLLPNKELKVAGGREVCLRDLQSWIFFAGASSMIIGNYLATQGRTAETDHQMLRDLGLTWRTYGGGGEQSACGCPENAKVIGSGKHAVPIVCEREVTGQSPESR
ncbi:MAG: biotin synthase BioB [Bacillota bacterium]